MNCEEFGKQLGVFADGELETAQDAGAAAHVKECAICSAEVDRLRALRGRLSGMFATENAPSGLADRVRAAVEETSARPVVRIGRFQRLLVPLGMAAAIVFAWGVSEYMGRTSGPTEGAAVPVEAQWVRLVRDQHKGCTKLGGKHHHAGWPRDVRRLKETIEAELKLAVMAPNLSEYGYALESADLCGIRDVPGAHLVYRRKSDGQLLSVFTLGSTESFTPAKNVKISGKECFVCEAPGPTVLAWHESGATYTFCGKFTVKELVTVAEAIRAGRCGGGR